ncbi:gluconokinase [Corynebacterium sp.]|uniref:gluconokinase n=1 Tax=Corynebacterium sp. TaxID=1720 RepID=UPI0027BAEAC1|nr:shikimate kinase [Corynebacterium sp.]
MRRHVVIMGVSSCGKSTVGELLAQRTGLPFRDGDDMHPAANIEKMAAGRALEGDDRTPWLESIGRFLAAQESGAIVGCSALKRSYRDLIRAAAPETVTSVAKACTLKKMTMTKMTATAAMAIPSNGPAPRTGSQVSMTFMRQSLLCAM